MERFARVGRVARSVAREDAKASRIRGSGGEREGASAKCHVPELAAATATPR